MRFFFSSSVEFNLRIKLSYIVELKKLDNSLSVSSFSISSRSIKRDFLTFDNKKREKNQKNTQSFLRHFNQSLAFKFVFIDNELKKAKIRIENFTQQVNQFIMKSKEKNEILMREKRFIKNIVMMLKTATQIMSRLFELTTHIKTEDESTNELFTKHDDILILFVDMTNAFEIKYNINFIFVSVDINKS